jgi:dihydroorotate dehydrogenase
MYARLRPVLFRLDPERAHALTLLLLAAAGSSAAGRRWLRAAAGPRPSTPSIGLFGLSFPNRLGLAAGYDKDGRAVRGLSSLGFGHVEVGTDTLRPQPGNPRPRIFRLTEDEALVNRMGFPNAGMEALIRRLARRDARPVITGVNLGKGRDTPLQSAGEDYAALVRGLGPWADYLAVNISSPNTPGLRDLQGRRWLEGLLDQVDEARRGLDRRVPVLVKLSPDLSEGELAEAVEVTMAKGIDGIIATNTTVARQGLRSARWAEAGGLSGGPLFQRSRSVVEAIGRRSQGGLPIVAAGGISTGAEARAMIDAGASLVQIYTALVYRGPRVVGEILEALEEA